MRRYIPKQMRQIPENANRVFKGVIYDVHQWEQELFDGTFDTFEMLSRADTTVAICIKDGKIILLNEEQSGIEGALLGFPGGRADHPDEDELQAIKREVVEETGMEFASWKLISAQQLTNKIDHLFYVFIAYDFQSQTEPKLDAGEKVEVMEVELSDLKDRVARGVLRDHAADQILHCQSLEDIINLPDLYS